ncbi:MAG TPA: zf-HC2 domain-containing protein [Solirubrobacteraceae bacterium]|jgi:anti-sigma factor RsiW|nr:zf-HC2 domain-containing protein [Solirubrobacteraceae bacterium]
MFWRNEELVCQEVVELVTDYLEGRLSRAQRKRFEAHLAGCEHCSEYLEQMRITIRLTGRLESGDLAPAVRDEFAALYRRWRAEGD